MALTGRGWFSPYPVGYRPRPWQKAIWTPSHDPPWTRSSNDLLHHVLVYIPEQNLVSHDMGAFKMFKCCFLVSEVQSLRLTGEQKLFTALLE